MFLANKISKDHIKLQLPFEEYLCGKLRHIPAGFVWDGASVLVKNKVAPRFGSDKYNEATLLHDWPYVHEGEMPEGDKISRKQVDGEFIERIKDELPNWRVSIIKFVLRHLGRLKWNEKY